MLGAHSRISCGPETRFFRFLSEVDVNEFYNEPSWPARAVEFLTSLHYVGLERVLDFYELRPKDATCYLEKRAPSIAAILSSLTESHMRKVGKNRWVEKTPDHILCVREIRRYFPDSPIIRIIRDPRDVALSLSKVPWGPSTFLSALLDWKYSDDQSSEFFLSDQFSYTVRYEDLLLYPEEVLKKLCEFIGEEFELPMLDTSQSYLYLRPAPWNMKTGEPVDRSRLFVWQKELTKEQNQLAEAFLGDRLIAYGYSTLESFPFTAHVFPSSDYLVRLHPNFITSLAAKRVKLWSLNAKSPRSDFFIYAARPDTEEWSLGWRLLQRLFNAMRLLAKIILTRLIGKHFFWICEESNQPTTRLSVLLSRMLRRFRVKEDQLLNLCEKEC
jgi:hypothetical protein